MYSENLQSLRSASLKLVIVSLTVLHHGGLMTEAKARKRILVVQVIDAEMARRKLLEESPIPSTNEEPVFFDTAEIPWWAWVRRFHLPEVRCPPAEQNVD